MSSWVDSGFEAARWISPPPAVISPTRTAVSGVMCRQAAIRCPANGCLLANSRASRPSTGIARCAQAILDDPMRPGLRGSVTVVVRLVRAFDWHSDVVGLLLAQLGQPDAERVQVQPGDSLVEVLGQYVHAERVLVGLGEQLDLGEHLVGEAGGHHEAR